MHISNIWKKERSKSETILKFLWWGPAVSHTDVQKMTNAQAVKTSLLHLYGQQRAVFVQRNDLGIMGTR